MHYTGLKTIKCTGMKTVKCTVMTTIFSGMQNITHRQSVLISKQGIRQTDMSIKA
jgi:hypothetical protein